MDSFTIVSLLLAAILYTGHALPRPLAYPLPSGHSPSPQQQHPPTTYGESRIYPDTSAAKIGAEKTRTSSAQQSYAQQSQQSYESSNKSEIPTPEGAAIAQESVGVLYYTVPAPGYYVTPAPPVSGPYYYPNSGPSYVLW